MSGLPLADELLLHLATPDRRAAAQHCAGLVGGGMALQHLVDHGLAPAMSQVGTLWESAVWTVVDEHTATAVAEAALSAAAAADLRPPPVLGEVVVACVEGDWHSLPGRMVAEVLDGHGWSVRFLGASHPTDLLIEHLTRHRPTAVLLSCAVPMALPALSNAIEEIHRLGLPVFVGGRALGKRATRAVTLQADGWASNAAGAVQLLSQTADLTAIPPGETAAARLAAYRSLQLHMTSWVSDAMDALGELVPAVRSYTPKARDRTRLDLHHLLDMAGIAVMLDDPTLIHEQCDWLIGVLVARGVPDHAVASGLHALQRTAPFGQHNPEITATLERAQQHLAVQLTILQRAQRGSETDSFA